MTFEEYQKFPCTQLKPGCDEIVFALGLGGETGEVLEVIKKARRDEKDVNMEHLREELGDVLWYLANLCTAYNLSLEQVAIDNKKKLDERYEGTQEKIIFVNYHGEKCSVRYAGPHLKLLDATGRFIKFISKQELQKIQNQGEQSNEDDKAPF